MKIVRGNRFAGNAHVAITGLPAALAKAVAPGVMRLDTQKVADLWLVCHYVV